MAASEGGLRAFSSLAMGAGVAPAVAFSIVNGDSTEMFQGDLMKMIGGGTVVAMAAVGDLAIVGVFVGCEFTDSDGQRQWSNKYNTTISRNDTIAYITTDLCQLYKVRIGNTDANTTLTQVEIGMTWDLELLSGNATTGQSGFILDSGTAGITGPANVRIVGLTNDDGTNDMFGSTSTTYSHAIVQLDTRICLFGSGVGV